MIISASRRTDIPAFYAEWFMKRIREGYLCVPNPMNTRQISVVDLNVDNVELIVFWTKNPLPLLPYLKELTERGYKYYFQYTVNNYPRVFEPNLPKINAIIDTFQELANKIGKEKVIWRYDPILISSVTDVNYHFKNITYLLEKLAPHTHHITTSIYDNYRGSTSRLKRLEKHGVVIPTSEQTLADSLEVLRYLSEEAKRYHLQIFSCAEKEEILRGIDIIQGKCIDPNYIGQVFNLDVNYPKDPSQREDCGCIQSKDIGSYDTCLHGCSYCYATRSFDLAKENHQKHSNEDNGLLAQYPLPRKQQGTLF